MTCEDCKNFCKVYDSEKGFCAVKIVEIEDGNTNILPTVNDNDTACEYFEEERIVCYRCGRARKTKIHRKGFIYLYGFPSDGYGQISCTLCTDCYTKFVNWIELNPYHNHISKFDLKG